MPQGSILASVLFSIFINNLGKDKFPAKLHLYADDTVIYSAASSLTQAVDKLQRAFEHLQSSLSELQLVHVVNVNKTKFMTLSTAHSQTPENTDIYIQTGESIKHISSFKGQFIINPDTQVLRVRI